MIAPAAARTPLVDAAAPALVVGLALDGKLASSFGRSFSHEMHFNRSAPFWTKHDRHFQPGVFFDHKSLKSPGGGVGSFDDLTFCRVASQRSVRNSFSSNAAWESGTFNGWGRADWGPPPTGPPKVPKGGVACEIVAIIALTNSIASRSSAGRGFLSLVARYIPSPWRSLALLLLLNATAMAAPCSTWPVDGWEGGNAGRGAAMAGRVVVIAWSRCAICCNKLEGGAGAATPAVRFGANRRRPWLRSPAAYPPG